MGLTSNNVLSEADADHVVEALYCLGPVLWQLEVFQLLAILSPNLLRPEHASFGLLIDVLLRQG